MLGRLETQEKQALGETCIWSITLFLIWMRLTDGIEVFGQSLGLTVVEQSPSSVLATWVSIGIVAAIAQLVLRGYLKAKGDAVDFRDERDRMLERRADRAGYWTGVVGANVIIGHVLLNETFNNGHAPTLELTSATGITLALLTLLTLKELARHTTILWLYRRV